MSLLYAVAPALPLGKAGKFVVAAYIAFILVILIYVAIMAVRAQRLEGELSELERDVEAARLAREAPQPAPEVGRTESVLAGRLTRAPGVASQPDDAAATRFGEPGRRAGGRAAGDRGQA